MDYRVSYQGHSMIVSIGHAHEPIRVDGEATIYSVSDGRANVDLCIRLAMRALWACQIVECEEDATSTDCVVWDDVEYERISSVGVASYRVWAVESGILQWEGAATSPAAALAALASDVGCELGDLPATLVEELGSDRDWAWSSTSETWVPAPRWWSTRADHR